MVKMNGEEVGTIFTPDGKEFPLILWRDGKLLWGAPKWLKEQREKLRQMPPPTLEEVQQQFEASARVRKQILEG